MSDVKNGQDIFKPLVACCVGEAPSLFAKAYRVKAKPGPHKCEFGIQVPMETKPTPHLDHIPSETNIADVLTKPLVGEKFYIIIKPLFFRVPSLS